MLSRIADHPINRIAELLLVESTSTESGKTTTLAEYIKRAPADQKEIFYLTGETRGQIEGSPYVEAFKSRGQEVLLFTDPIDEFVINSLGEFQGKRFRAIDRGQLEADAKDEQLKTKTTELKSLLELVKTTLPNVKEVRLTSRLKDSAACLVADENAMSAHMERLMKRAGRADELPPSQRILELNPDHALVSAMQKIYAKAPSDSRVAQIASVLYDQAVIAEGSRLQDPAGFSKRLTELLVNGLSV